MPKNGLTSPIEGMEKLPELALLVNADPTAAYLARMAIGLGSNALVAHAPNFGASSTAEKHTATIDRINTRCLDLGISPPVFVRESRHPTIRTVTGLALELCMADPDLDLTKLPEMLVLRSFIIDGVVTEACVIDEKTAEWVLDYFGDRQRSHVDLFELTIEAKQRHSTLVAEIYARQCVTLKPNIQVQTQVAGEAVPAVGEKVTTDINYDEIINNFDPKDQDLARTIVEYVANGNNFDEQIWKTLERHPSRGAKRVMSHLRNDPRLGSHGITRFNLVAETVGVPRAKKAKTPGAW